MANVLMLYTVKEAAKMLHISPQNLYRLRAEDKIGYIKIGGKYLHSQEHLDQFLSDNEHGPAAAPAVKPKPPRRPGGFNHLH